MQSQALADPAQQERPWPKRSSHRLPLLLFGVLPFVCLAAELPTGMLRRVNALNSPAHPFAQ